jgi:hypothetical protein
MSGALRWVEEEGRARSGSLQMNKGGPQHKIDGEPLQVSLLKKRLVTAGDF